MTPKERAAMQQALDALEDLIVYSWNDGKNGEPDKAEDYAGVEAITALREALDPELQFVRDWNEGKVRRVSDGKIMGVAEKAEQEPVAKFLEDNLVVENERVGKSGHRVLEIREEELLRIMEIYAAPVRTKDLTDDEVMHTYTNFNLNELGEQSFMIGFARAVIAADREKNK